jgi:hypothetical protein
MASAPFSPEEREELLDRYHALLGAARHHERNPLEQPVSMAREDLPKLLAEDYVVLRKSDGVRHTLFLTSTRASPSVAVLLDRRLTLRRIPVAARKDFFAGTVLDCELVQARAGALLLAFDLLALKGEGITAKPYAARGALLAACLPPEPEPGDELPEDFDAREREVIRRVRRGWIVLGANGAGLALYVKGHAPLGRLEALLAEESSHPSDGLVFVAAGRGARAGTSRSTFKLKSRHTVDLEVEPKQRRILCGRGGGPETAVERVELDAAEFCLEPRFWEATTALLGHNGGIVECALLPGRRLAPLCERRDKSHPNTLDVVRRTAVDLEEGLAPEELVAFLRARGALEARTKA